MALGWLGGSRSEHALASEKDAKEIFDGLRKAEPAACLQEVRDWVDSVVVAEGLRPDRKAEIVKLLDDVAQAPLRKLSRDYFAAARMPRAQEARQWDALFKFWKQLASGYAASLDQIAADKNSAGRMKALLPLVGVRAVRAAAAQLKWHHLHYEHSEREAWEKLAKVYRFLDERKLVREAFAVFPPAPGASSAERELVKALMLAASSPDCLRPVEIEIAENIIAHLGAALLISDANQPKVTYHWVDLAGGGLPRRLTDTPPASPGLRFFAAGEAAGKLDEIIRVAERGAVPSDLNLGGTYEPPLVLGVLRHLRSCWTAPPAVRQHDRYPVKHRLSVVNGFTGVLGKLSGTADGAETWETADIGAGGIGALVATPAEWFRVGSLVGLQVEGGSSSLTVGVVRRCVRVPRQPLSVAIRTFGRESFAVRPGGEHDALLLNDGRVLKEEALVCLRAGVFDPRASLSMPFEGQEFLLMPVGIVYNGEEFDVARYRVMKPS